MVYKFYKGKRPHGFQRMKPARLERERRMDAREKQLEAERMFREYKPPKGEIKKISAPAVVEEENCMEIHLQGTATATRVKKPPVGYEYVITGPTSFALRKIGEKNPNGK